MPTAQTTDSARESRCYHCGQPGGMHFRYDGRVFCCLGCKAVYDLLRENDLCGYYDIQQAPGLTRDRLSDKDAYSFLGEVEARKRLLQFDSPELSKVTFSVPAIHCASCIWLLESLSKLKNGVIRSQVHFGRKQVTIWFKPSLVTLRETAETLDLVGYPPLITLNDSGLQKRSTDHQLLTRLAVAGFAFGNIMLFSFPEYLGLDTSDALLRNVFTVLNLALAVPVTFYSGWPFLNSAWKSVIQKAINIDVPIALGLLVVFLRSSYEMMTGLGAGYMDSLTGLVFFLLIGRWFQQKTYESLSFERDFRSYFPLAVNRKDGEVMRPVLVQQLERGDHIQIRNGEILPADSYLQDSDCLVDYSFVTGEARPVQRRKGELVFAGGRLVGKPANFLVDKATSGSYLTSLWNNDTFRKEKEVRFRRFIDQVARNFTWAVLFVAVVSGVFWATIDSTRMWMVISSVLLVACPCALALSAPFTLGTLMRILGRMGFYVKSTDVLERLARVNFIVFDKTGTLTQSRQSDLQFEGILTDNEKSGIAALVSCSTHPLSVTLARQLAPFGKERSQIDDFAEIPGKGLSAKIGGRDIKLGSALFVGSLLDNVKGTAVWVSINSEVKGYFALRSTPREGVKELVESGPVSSWAVVSGDNDEDRKILSGTFPQDSTQLHFGQSPHEKMEYISSLQSEGRVVMMVGDGLNDAGALRQSDVGVAVTEESGVFTPSSDAILEAGSLRNLGRFIELSRKAGLILWMSYGISLLYNIVGLSIAISGNLTPVYAAILMPLSSITVVGFTTIATSVAGRKTIPL